MRTAVVLPRRYEGQLLYEAKKSGLAIEHEIPVPGGLTREENEELDNNLYGTAWALRQKMFQMILLFDEIIIPGISPLNDYQRLMDTGFFSMSTIDDYMSYATEKDLYSECGLTSKYLKPALLPILHKKLSQHYDGAVKGLSKRKFAENIYDAFFEAAEKGKALFSPEMVKAFEKSELTYDVRREIAYNTKHYFPKESIEFLMKNLDLWTYLSHQIAYEYEYINMLLDYANERNANIVNCEYQLAKIGCENMDISSMVKNYATIRVECKNIIGTLPKLNSLQEVLELKSNNHKSIVRLRQVLSEFEDTLRHSGGDNAIKNIKHDVELAVKDVNRKSSSLSKIGAWTTILSVPISIAEALLGSLPVVGIPIGLLGTTALIATKHIEHKNSWVHVVR